MLKVLDKKGFQEYFFMKSITVIRVTMLMAVILYGLTSALAPGMLPQSKQNVWFLQFLLVLWCFAIIILSYFKSFQNYYQFVLSITAYLIGAGNISVIAMAKPGELGYLYCYNGLFLVLVAATILFRFKLWLSLVNGTIILVAYSLVYIFYQPTFANADSRVLFFNNIFFLTSTFLISFTSHYFFEYYLRKDFNNLLTINQANLKLKELDQTKSKFFANISHEFRTPLTLILSPMEALIQGDYGDTIPRNHFAFQSIYNNTLNLLKLINNLLDFTKLEAGKMTVRKKKTDVSRLVEFYIANVRSAAENKGLKIASQVSTPGLIAYIDPDLFEKAVFNLISNALKFTPEGGRITVELKEYHGEGGYPDHEIPKNKSLGQTGCFQISVTDTGIGIPEDQLSNLFQRFSQLDNSSSRKYEGTGIGLALTKEIVELLGGTIEVRSKIGEGSVFTIILPKGMEEAAAINAEFTDIENIKPYLLSGVNPGKNAFHQETGVGAPRSGNVFRILIVDDNLDMLTFLTSILRNDYSIITAVNGIEGFQKATTCAPDLILADVMMPEMDGYEMTAQIRQIPELKGIPIILLTAKAEIPMKIEGLTLGANDYIAKPFNARELLARIKSQLEMKQLRDEIIQQKKALEKSEIRFREMADFLAAAIIEINQEFEMTYANHTALQILDLTKEDLLQKLSIIQFIEPDHQSRFVSEMGKNMANNLSDVYKYQLRRRGVAPGQAGDFLVLLKVSPFFHENETGLRITFMEIDALFNLVSLPDDGFYKKYGITDKEKTVLIEVLMGRRNKEIAAKLFISEIAVKKHVSSLFQKTGTANRSELLKLTMDDEACRFPGTHIDHSFRK